jgi:hypothetical protein
MLDTDWMEVIRGFHQVVSSSCMNSDALSLGLDGKVNFNDCFFVDNRRSFRLLFLVALVAVVLQIISLISGKAKWHCC